jgi:hypothetical protein
MGLEYAVSACSRKTSCDGPLPHAEPDVALDAGVADGGREAQQVVARLEGREPQLVAVFDGADVVPAGTKMEPQRDLGGFAVGPARDVDSVRLLGEPPEAGGAPARGALTGRRKGGPYYSDASKRAASRA